MVVNVFAQRATDSDELKTRGIATKANTKHVCKALKDADRIVFAWGTSIAKAKERDLALLNMARVARKRGARPMCLGVSKAGHPKHPLMLGYSTPLVSWEGYEGAEWDFLR